MPEVVRLAVDSAREAREECKKMLQEISQEGHESAIVLTREGETLTLHFAGLSAEEVSYMLQHALLLLHLEE